MDDHVKGSFILGINNKMSFEASVGTQTRGDWLIFILSFWYECTQGDITQESTAMGIVSYFEGHKADLVVCDGMYIRAFLYNRLAPSYVHVQCG